MIDPYATTQSCTLAIHCVRRIHSTFTKSMKAFVLSQCGHDKESTTARTKFMDTSTHLSANKGRTQMYCRTRCGRGGMVLYSSISIAYQNTGGRIDSFCTTDTLKSMPRTRESTFLSHIPTQVMNWRGKTRAPLDQRHIRATGTLASL